MQVTDKDKALIQKNLVVNGSNDCWGWKGAHTMGFYPIIKLGGRNGVVTTVSRVLCFLQHGPANNRNALHSCDNQMCLNPKHIYWGTQAENIQQAYSKGRRLSPMMYKRLNNLKEDS